MPVSPVRRDQLIVLALVVVSLAGLKLMRLAGASPYGLDASYYVQIARNVMSGAGPMSNVSLYCEGWVLPTKAAVQPLWPLLLGLSGRLLGLETAANVLPFALFVLNLVLLYFVAAAVAGSAERLRISPRAYVPDAGHLLVILLALNLMFFASSTHPYTEGLGYATAFASFLILRRAEARSSLMAFVLAGVLAGLAFATRTQMAGIAAGQGAALLLFMIKGRRRFWELIGYGAGVLTTVAATVVWLGFVPGFGWLAGREPSRVAIPPFEHWVRTDSAVQLVLDRTAGLLVAFRVGDPMSYAHTFGVAALLVPIAAAWWLVSRLRSRGEGEEPVSATALAVTFSGLFFFVTLLFFHGRYFRPWFFSWRHGITLIFLLVPAVLFLVHRGKWAKTAVVVMLVLSFITGALAVAHFLSEERVSPFVAAERAALDSIVPQGSSTPVFLATNAQQLALLAPWNFHWTDCSVSASTTRLMLDRLRIGYVLIHEGEDRCDVFRGVLRGRVVSTRLFGEPGRQVMLARLRVNS